MRRSSLVAIALLAAAANAGAQEAFDALDFPETEADRSAEVDFIMRPTQEAALGSDQFWILQLEPEPAPPIGPPLAGPTEEEAIGPPMAGPERPAPDGPFILRGTENDLDPFAATGLHLGSFVIRPAIEIGVSATDNVGGRAEKEGAVGAVIAPEINIRAEDERYEVEADLRGEAVFYRDDEFDDREAEARLRARYDLTSRTSLNAELGYATDLESFTDRTRLPPPFSGQRCISSTRRSGRRSASGRLLPAPVSSPSARCTRRWRSPAAAPPIARSWTTPNMACG